MMMPKTIYTFAVDGNCAIGRLANGEEPFHDYVGWSGTVRKKEIPVLESRPGESSSIVNPLIQTDDGGDVILPKVGEIGFRSVLSFFFILGRMRSAESDELVRNNPVEITILNPLKETLVNIYYYV